jgi:RNA recognition motif-containing protein
MPTCINESEQETQPQVVKPRNPKGEGVTHGKAAKKQDLKKFNKGAVNNNIATTLMIRGIPCSFSQEALITLIDDAGLKDKYNFFYLPRDGNRNSNLGYAFINFVDQPSADLCTQAFRGVPLAPARSSKTCMVSPGDIQGLPALWKHFRRTAVTRSSHGPMFL